MAYLFGKQIKKEDLMKRMGDISQLAGAKKYELSSGKAKGISAIDVKTGTGFEFTILPDRGMDIAWASFKGIPISFISKTGVVSPFFHDDKGKGFLRNFYAGFLTTCGLTYFGAPCIDSETSLGLHGRAGNTPADDISIYQEWEDDDFVIRIRGKIRESIVFGENIVLTRQIETRLGSNKVIIEDIVENCGFNVQPLMLLYHCNFGYPIASEDSKLYINSKAVKPRDKDAEAGIENYDIFQKPTHDYLEQVFYHDVIPYDNCYAKAILFNENLDGDGLGGFVKFNKNQLKNLIEWKQMGEGDYVVGLEPSTSFPEGRAKARENKELEFIMPGERKTFHIEIGVVKNPNDII